jgi:phage regulator Rha-like protein
LTPIDNLAQNTHMKDIIPVLNQGGNEFLVDSRQVAKLFGLTPQHVRERIEEFKEELTQLGVFRFETGKPLKGSPGGRPERFYWINFDQLLFLLFRTRPTEDVKKFHVPLILAFRHAREKLRPIDSMMLSIPDEWRKTFKDEFYEALLRIYGQIHLASQKRQSWVGRWTNKFIYEPIFNSLPAELKAKRKAYCGISGKDADFIRLHQFFEKYAKEDLKERIAKITAILQFSGSKHDFKEKFQAVFRGENQQNWDEDFGSDDGDGHDDPPPGE